MPCAVVLSETALLLVKVNGLYHKNIYHTGVIFLADKRHYIKFPVDKTNPLCIITYTKHERYLSLQCTFIKF